MNLLTRFIPAGAGNTEYSIAAVSISAVYPRWRGEHRERLRSQCVLYGLSPLARGTPGANCSHPRNRRFIPAGAGNTTGLYGIWFYIPVYPRWRGEHWMQQSEEARMAGLSPLARVTLAHLTDDNARLRFIPAGVGNTARWLPTTGQPSVYPRWRGEHVLIAVVTVGICGLSPLARGTHAKGRRDAVRERFIPAGAGNTKLDHGETVHDAVYPRWRGEHASRKQALQFRNGLSPLARGTQQITRDIFNATRFIPAGAGNTSWWSNSVTGRSVYPRWRGEHGQR